MISKFFFNFSNFCVAICNFLTKLLMLGILFSTAVNAVFVAKPVILVILFSISLILVLQNDFLTRPLISGILFSNFNLSASYFAFKIKSLVSILFTLLTNLLYSVFLTTSFFTTFLNLVKSTGTVFSLSVSNLSTLKFLN